MDKKGHWYTDKNGNHYFVEEGQSPKEGWEQSKRRKMISGGKYMVDEGDGSDPREATKEEYDNYEADESEFDETVDDDFGFDEEEDDVVRSAEKQDERKLFLKEKGLDGKYEIDENGYLIDKAEGTAVLDFNQLDDDFDEVEHQISVYEKDQEDYADEETFNNIRAQYMANGGYFEDLKKEFPDADDDLIRGAMNTDINNFDDYLDYRDKKGGWAEEDEEDNGFNDSDPRSTGPEAYKKARTGAGEAAGVSDDADKDFKVGDSWNWPAGDFVVIEEEKDGRYKIDSPAIRHGLSKEEWLTKDELNSRIKGSRKVINGLNPWHGKGAEYYEKKPGDSKTGTEVFENLKNYVGKLSDDEKEMLLDLLKHPRKE